MRFALSIGYARAMAAALAALLAWALQVTSVNAHEGPPFPILMDEATSNYVVSIWADPDVGEAVFYVYVTGRDGEPPEAEPTVTLSVTPKSGRLSKIEYDGVRQELRNRLQFEVRPHFDECDLWTIGVQLGHPGGPAEFVTTEVESTPPGLGTWDLAIYAFPFALLAGMWGVAIARRRKAARTADA